LHPPRRRPAGPGNEDCRIWEVASRDDIRTLADGQVLLRDADGNRYRIPNYHRLDAKSRKLLEPQL